MYLVELAVETELHRHEEEPFAYLCERPWGGDLDAHVKGLCRLSVRTKEVLFPYIDSNFGAKGDNINESFRRFLIIAIELQERTTRGRLRPAKISRSQLCS